MATPKINNSKEMVSNVAEMAAKMTGETKVAVDVMVDTAAKATEETKTLLASNQDTMTKSLAMWQEYQKTYFDTVLKATQQGFDQSLAFREQLDKIMIDSFKKAHTLNEQERQIGLNAAELFQAQAQSASEYSAKLITTTSKMITTTALFSDWAAERVAKMFTGMSSN